MESSPLIVNLGLFQNHKEIVSFIHKGRNMSLDEAMLMWGTCWIFQWSCPPLEAMLLSNSVDIFQTMKTSSFCKYWMPEGTVRSWAFSFKGSFPKECSVRERECLRFERMESQRMKWLVWEFHKSKHSPFEESLASVWQRRWETRMLGWRKWLVLTHGKLQQLSHLLLAP